MPDAATRRRFKVVFTPVGWQVVDTQIARDPVAEFGTGSDEYERAKAAAARINAKDEVVARQSAISDALDSLDLPAIAAEAIRREQDDKP